MCAYTIRPIHFKVGVALAISVGGVFYAYFTFNNPNRSKSPKNKSPGNGDDNQIDSKGEENGHDLRDDDLSFPGSSVSDRLPVGDQEGLLLTESNDLGAEECNLAPTTTVSHKKNANHISYDDEHDPCLDQEMTVMELHNCLRLHNLKIESLVSHNRRLEAQLAAYAHLVKEIDVEKAKTKVLKKKLKSEAEQNYKDKILTLQDQVRKLQERGAKEAMEISREEERKEWESRLEDVKRTNQALKLENADLRQKLEYLQMLATSALESGEMHEIKEESRCLKQRNEELQREIERIQADRWSDIEELVYLRWINTCLRYELRNYNPGSGKTTPGDSNNGKLLSPKSEERVKHLVFEGAYRETDIDSDQCPSMHSSVVTTDSGDREEPPLANKIPVDKSTVSSKTKVLSKLKKLLSSAKRNQEKKSNKLERAASVENLAAAAAPSNDDQAKSLRNSSTGSTMSRRSFDLPKSCPKTRSCSNSARNSDVGTSSTITRINSVTEEEGGNEYAVLGRGGSPPLPQDVKEELLKYAEALKKSRCKTRGGRSTAYESS